MHFSVTIKFDHLFIHHQWTLRLSLTFCSNLSHVSRQSVPVESSISPLIYLLLTRSFRYPSSVFQIHHYHIYAPSRLGVTEHLTVSLKPLEAVKSVLCCASLSVCDAALLCYHSDWLCWVRLCSLCRPEPGMYNAAACCCCLECLSRPLFWAVGSAMATGAANPSWYVTTGTSHVSVR